MEIFVSDELEPAEVADRCRYSRRVCGQQRGILVLEPAASRPENIQKDILFVRKTAPIRKRFADDLSKILSGALAVPRASFTRIDQIVLDPCHFEFVDVEISGDDR